MRADVSDLYETLRPLVFSIAYRMLGSASDAEDIVQEAFLRLHRESVKGTEILSPQAYLSAITTRLSIDHLRSARVRRERYTGTWLPEPLLTDEGSDAVEHADTAETADSLSMAFLVLLESLTPVERAVFLLREVFDYGYDQIAAVVGKSEDNCRRSPCALAVRSMPRGRDSRPRGSGETSSLGGSSTRFPHRTRQSSRICSPRTSSPTPMEAARPWRSRGRSTGGNGWPGCCSDPRRKGDVWRSAVCASWRSTGSREPSSWIPRAGRSLP